MAAYKWKEAARVRANAQAAGELMEALGNSGGLTPERLVDASREQDALLHGEFEWNDVIAGELYRSSQARYLMRNILRIQEQEEKEPVRAFFAVEQDYTYDPITMIIKNEDKQKKLMTIALRELAAFARKFSMLKKLQPVFDAINQLTLEELTEEAPK